MSTHQIPLNPSIVVGEHVLTVPVDDAVNDAFDRWLEDHRASLAESLAPYGVNLLDLLPAKLRRIITVEELRDALAGHNGATTTVTWTQDE